MADESEKINEEPEKDAVDEEKASEEQSEKEDARGHRRNRRDREHLVPADIFKALSEAVSERTNPQRIHLLFRR